MKARSEGHVPVNTAASRWLAVLAIPMFIHDHAPEPACQACKQPSDMRRAGYLETSYSSEQENLMHTPCMLILTQHCVHHAGSMLMKHWHCKQLPWSRLSFVCLGQITQLTHLLGILVCMRVTVPSNNPDVQSQGCSHRDVHAEGAFRRPDLQLLCDCQSC